MPAPSAPTLIRLCGGLNDEDCLLADFIQITNSKPIWTMITLNAIIIGGHVTKALVRGCTKHGS